MECLLFSFAGNDISTNPINVNIHWVEKQTCRQVCRYALRLTTFLVFLDGEQVWSPFVSLPELQFRQVFVVLYQSSSEVNGCFTIAFQNELVTSKHGNVFGETLGVDESQPFDLLGRMFVPGFIDKLQNSLTWQYYWGELPVRDKLYRHSGTVSLPCYSWKVGWLRNYKPLSLPLGSLFHLLRKFSVRVF